MTELRQQKVADLVAGLLVCIEPASHNREGLRETPERVARAYAELFAGYYADVPALFKEFTVEYDGMVVLRDVPFVSSCEHHMMPFSGVAHVGYIPEGKVVGLSKMARLVDAHARRLQVQERMTGDIAKDMNEHLRPKGCGCVVVATHGCMTCRGVMKHGTKMVTDTLIGAFKDDARTRAEFLQACKG